MNLTVNREAKAGVGEPYVPAARYYLLDGDFCVISAHTGEENAHIGASFFELFPANRPLREEIAAYVRSYPSDVLLTLCARTPVLFVGTLAAQSGLILAAVPEGEIKKTLSFPAAFHRVPACVCVSTSAQMKYRAHGAAEFAAASRWLLGVSAPFVQHPGAEQLLTPILSFAAARLSALLGVPLSCDFSGLSATDPAGVNVEFAVGVMLATLMAARRALPATGVHLCAVSEGTPTLYLEYRRADAVDSLPELSPLLACARARGVVLDAVFPKEDPHLLQLRACIGVAELSAQGLRERARFLEGKSPLATVPVAHAIATAFPEISFD